MTVLLLTGFIGVLGMTWLFPLLARLLWSRQHDSARAASDTLGFGKCGPPTRFTVIIPAHNEESVLSETLKSIVAAVRYAQARVKGLQVRVVVGADSCSDETVAVAEAEGADVIHFFEKQGKWQVLRQLIAARSESDWIALADAGVSWKEDFLLQSLPLCSLENIMAVAPTYYNPNGGWIEKGLWKVERHLKGLESSAGGPVTMHGATVLYRCEELSAVLETLGDQDWINDDVVVPLLLRSHFPTKEIRYETRLGVSERSPSAPRMAPMGEFQRRRRVVLGNIQWMRQLLPLTYRENPIAALLAGRRVFRLFWAYWGLLLVLPAAFFLVEAVSVPLGVVVGISLMLTIGFLRLQNVALVRRFVESAYASFLAPYYFCTARSFEKTVWK